MVFDVSTMDMLKTYGSQKPKGRGRKLTYQQLWDREPYNNSKRYAIRIALLKLALAM